MHRRGGVSATTPIFLNPVRIEDDEARRKSTKTLGTLAVPLDREFSDRQPISATANHYVQMHVAFSLIAQMLSPPDERSFALAFNTHEDASPARTQTFVLRHVLTKCR